MASSSNSSSTPVPNQTRASPEAVPTYHLDSSAEYLLTVSENLSKAYPYRLTENTSGALTIDRITDFAAADRIHSSWTQDGNSYETITIEAQTWQKINGTWQDSSSYVGSSVDIFQALIIPNLQYAYYFKQEIVLDIPCFRFSYGLRINASEASLNGTGTAWIGISDGLPHQIDLEVTVNGVPQTTHLVYRYGVQLDIQQPVP